MGAKIDAFLATAPRWREEMERLRLIARTCGLDEALKWRKPCYCYDGGNVAIVQPFKDRVALLFFKGSLLKDPEGLLAKPGPNSRVGRRMEFSGIDEVVAQEDRIRGFLVEAIEIEKAGLRAQPSTDPGSPPPELEEMFARVAGLKEAFEALTPGRRRHYVLHFTGARQSKTRRSRVERCVPRILSGKGLRD